MKQATLNNFTCITKNIRVYIRGEPNPTRGRCLNYDSSILFIKNESEYIEGLPLANIMRIIMLPEDNE